MCRLVEMKGKGSNCKITTTKPCTELANQGAGGTITPYLYQGRPHRFLSEYLGRHQGDVFHGGDGLSDYGLGMSYEFVGSAYKGVCYWVCGGIGYQDL